MENNNIINISTIGKRIQSLREKKGLTQSELAKKLNVKQQTINQWENEERDLKTGAIISLSKYFNVSADYLLGLSDAPTNDKDLAAVCKYTGLSEKAIKTLHIWAKHNLDNPDYEEYTEFVDTLISNEIIYTKLVDEFQKYMSSLERCRLLELDNSDIDFEERNKFIMTISDDGEIDTQSEINEIKKEYNKEIDDVQAFQLYKMQNTFVNFIKGYGAVKKNDITSIEEIAEKWQKKKEYYDKLQKFCDDNKKWAEERTMEREAKEEAANNGKHTGAAE